MTTSGPKAGSGQFFDDLARMTSGAIGAFSGFRDHMEAEVRSCAMRFAREMDFVPREEFEIVEAMAKKARQENEALKKRLDMLEKSVKTSSG
jgi:BMFP domain-containing protein YqiC